MTREPDELVGAAARGDRAAFGRLYGEHGPFVRAVLASRVPPHLIDDLLQEVFITVWDKLGQLREGAALRPWLATIARRAAADHSRSAKPVALLPDNLATRDAPMAEAQRMVARIRTLPEPYVEPLLLRLVAGMSGPEIAEHTGLTPGSVRVNLCRGFKLLREQLGGET